jgi:hypothetical protein
LSKYLPEIPAVFSGYSSHREQCQNTIGFGYHADCIIFADWNDQGVVEHIWTSIFTTEALELADLVSALQNLGQRFPLLYVDWAWSFATPLEQSGNLYDRLESKNTEIASRMQERD